jgi:broad specificity phosphatase PhoE
LLLRCICLLIPLSALPTAAAEDVALWSALRQGDHAALIRHALAPGTGDPPGFRLEDCSTQRNLSEQGRAQARDIGARFRDHGIEQAEVLSSQWCRCLETARRLGLGAVTPFDGLNSFFRDRSHVPERTAAVRALLRQRLSDTHAVPLVLVTHQVNITALTDVFPAAGEMVVVRLQGDRVTVLGRLAPSKGLGRPAPPQ